MKFQFASQFRVFKVLMWKHYIVRKRRFLIALVELFTPFLTFLSMIAFRSAIENRSEEFRLPVLKLSLDSRTSDPRILYTPDTDLTRMLMDQVGEALYLPRFDAVPKQLTKFATEKYERSYLSSNESQFGGALNAMQSVDAVIVFENFEGDRLPDNLNYTVRVKAPSKGISSLPRERSYEYLIDLGEPFIRLQWAIDSSFIKLKSDTDADLQNITIQQFQRFGLSTKNNRVFVDVVFFALDLILLLAPLLSFVLIMVRLNEEKSTGIQELIEMFGVTPWMLGITHFLNSLPPCLLFSIGGTMLIYVNRETTLQTNPFIIFIGLFLHFMTMIAMAFASSYITKTSQHTISVSMFAYIGSWIPICLLRPGGFSQFVLFLKGLLPHGPPFWFIYETYTSEHFQAGINFENWSTQFHNFKDSSKCGSTRMSFTMQLIQIFYFFALSWYLKKVRPGKYGIALPWNFLCQKEFWMKYPSIPAGISNKSTYDSAYSKYFEDPPDNLEVAVNVVNVRKIFSSQRSNFVALDNVSLKFYRGEITVLVGHNGAGKTTLISIIAGMIKQSSGKVYVDGLDTTSHQAQLRKKIALCPQHNLFFPDLTVQEHLMFFSLLKGGTNKEAMQSSEELLKQLGLTEKASWSTSKLSGGMLRRLQIGCTLCNDASILLLDEPTSGLDIEARRDLWDILLMLRGERTVIMTSHFLDEADILGDRIVALHSGTLRCCATPAFLKKAVGSGFRVSITTALPPDVDKITSSMRRASPDAILKSKTLRTLVFDLPPGADMTNLFNNLEFNKITLGIESMGVGAVSLEEAFMELCSDVETESFNDREEDLATPDKFNYAEGRKLILIQIMELFKRQFDYTVSKLKAFIFLQFIIPFVMCILLTQLFCNTNERDFFIMDLNVYNEINAPVATYNFRSDSSDIEKSKDTIKFLYPNLILRETNIHHDKGCTCRKCKEQSKAPLTRNIIEVYVDEQQASLRYDPTVKHSAAVGLNLLSNIIALQRLRQAHDKPINMQLVFDDEENLPLLKSKDEINCILFATLNIFVIMATAINDVELPCRERISNSRYLHIMAGCPPVLFWIVTLVYHMTSYMLLYCSGTMIAAAFFDTDDTLNNSATLRAYFFGLFLCGLSFYVFAYFLSYLFNEKTTGVLLLTLVIIFGLFTPLVTFGLRTLGVIPHKTPITIKVLNDIGVLFPAHMFTQTIKKMTDVSRFNAYCSHLYKSCPTHSVLRTNFDTKICCDRSREYGAWVSHYEMSEYGMGKSLLGVTAHIVVFTSLVLLLEYRLIRRLWSEVEKRRTLVLPTRKYENSDVAEEKQYVSNTIARSKETIKEIMLVSRTWKAYFKLFEEPTFALKDVNYSVKKGECFGIIGLNGAGKTTNFKVITRQEYPTRGTIYANGYFADANPAEYLSGLGYCPQTFGLDNFRTGEANLRTLMSMRGLSKEDIKNETRSWLSIIGLVQSAGRRAAGYSGGMTRRLAVGAALSGGVRVALLDEPTAGVDTAAKRQVWLAVKRALESGRCVVLSSHNMDEVERLCNRVTVLDAGEMGALGSPTRYKELYALGHTVIFKLRVNSVLSEVGAIRVQSLKDFMDHEFDCFVKDEHLTALRFTITNNLPYNVIFIKLGFLAAEFDDIVEDYSAYDANMEDAFMHFVKENRYSIRPNETW